MTQLTNQTPSSAGTGSSVAVQKCQVCGCADLESTLFLGYIPPVNSMPDIDKRPVEQPAYPAELLFCPKCKLVQIGCIVDPEVLFAHDYPYTSGTTGILHRNFTEMVEDCTNNVLKIGNDDLVVDIGSNDGTLLSKWKEVGYKVHGIEPTDKAQLAIENGIPSTQAFFTEESASKVASEHGKAKVLTATNVFAHIEDVHSIVSAVLSLLDDDGVFINESHYLGSLLETLQYDTIYHEHLRYYSLHSMQYLLDLHGLEIINVKKIPTHGGSIRVYSARKGKYPVQDSVTQLLKEEADKGVNSREALDVFAKKVVESKLKLYSLLEKLKAEGARVYAISAPSRASTLVTYTGLDNGIIDCVVEIKGSHKIGKYMPGTIIPVLDEQKLFDDQPEYALLFAWHIGEELAGILRKHGFKGKFIIPLPEPYIV